jgi:hypothetical protein
LQEALEVRAVLNEKLKCEFERSSLLEMVLFFETDGRQRSEESNTNVASFMRRTGYRMDNCFVHHPNKEWTEYLKESLN